MDTHWLSLTSLSFSVSPHLLLHSLHNPHHHSFYGHLVAPGDCWSHTPYEICWLFLSFVLVSPDLTRGLRNLQIRMCQYTLDEGMSQDTCTFFLWDFPPPPRGSLLGTAPPSPSSPSAFPCGAFPLVWCLFPLLVSSSSSAPCSSLAYRGTTSEAGHSTTYHLITLGSRGLSTTTSSPNCGLLSLFSPSLRLPRGCLSVESCAIEEPVEVSLTVFPKRGQSQRGSIVTLETQHHIMARVSVSSHLSYPH